MYLWVWSDILQTGWCFTYSIISGITVSRRLHSACRNGRQPSLVCARQLSAQAKSSSELITAFISSAAFSTSVLGGQCFLGESQIQSNCPLSGCVPEVSRNML